MLGLKCQRVAIERQTQLAGGDDGGPALIEGSHEGMIFLRILRRCPRPHPRHTPTRKDREVRRLQRRSVPVMDVGINPWVVT
jgi:hypothetical protein